MILHNKGLFFIHVKSKVGEAALWHDFLPSSDFWDQGCSHFAALQSFTSRCTNGRKNDLAYGNLIPVLKTLHWK